LLYFEATYRIGLTRSGVVCDRVTRRRLIKDGLTKVTVGKTVIAQEEDGTYFIRNETEAHSFKFHRNRWYGGRLDHGVLWPQPAADAASD
jgi:hypothetical protein